MKILSGILCCKFFLIFSSFGMDLDADLPKAWIWIRIRVQWIWIHKIKWLGIHFGKTNDACRTGLTGPSLYLCKIDVEVDMTLWPYMDSSPSMQGPKAIGIQTTFQRWTVFFLCFFMVQYPANWRTSRTKFCKENHTFLAVVFPTANSLPHRVNNT